MWIYFNKRLHKRPTKHVVAPRKTKNRIVHKWREWERKTQVLIQSPMYHQSFCASIYTTSNIAHWARRIFSVFFLLFSCFFSYFTHSFRLYFVHHFYAWNYEILIFFFFFILYSVVEKWQHCLYIKPPLAALCIFKNCIHTVCNTANLHSWLLR